MTNTSMAKRMRLFIDTTVFIALEDEDDKEHKTALDYREKIRRGETPFRALYASNYVLDGVFTLLRLNLSHRAALAFKENIKRSKKDFSFTDCTSFALMEHVARGNY